MTAANIAYPSKSHPTAPTCTIRVHMERQTLPLNLSRRCLAPASPHTTGCGQHSPAALHYSHLQPPLLRRPRLGPDPSPRRPEAVLTAQASIFGSLSYPKPGLAGLESLETTRVCRTECCCVPVTVDRGKCL